MEHCLWIKNIWGQINKYVKWNRIFHIYFAKNNNGTSLRNSVNGLICTPLQSPCNYSLHLMHWIQPYLRHHFSVKVSFAHSTKIISIILINTIATSIQRIFFAWGRRDYTCPLLLFLRRSISFILPFSGFLYSYPLVFLFCLKKLRYLMFALPSVGRGECHTHLFHVAARLWMLLLALCV